MSYQWVGVALLGLLAVLAGALSPTTAGPALAALMALAALAATAMPATTRHVGALVRFYVPSFIAFAAVLALLALHGALVTDGAPVAAAAREAFVLIGFALGALAVAAAARSIPWRRINLALLAAGALGGLVTASGAFGAPSGGVGATFGGADATAILFGLVLLQAAFTAGDEIARRERINAPTRLAPLGQRLAMPAITALIATAMIMLSGSRIGVICVLTAVALFAGCWTLRERHAGALLFRLAAVGSALAALGFSFAWAAVDAADTTPAAPLLGRGLGAHAEAGSAALQWLDRIGPVGIGLWIIVLVVFAAQVAMAEDRRRKPARGFALLVGIGALAALSSLATQAFLSPAVAGWAALACGLAASIIDQRRSDESKA